MKTEVVLFNTVLYCHVHNYGSTIYQVKDSTKNFSLQLLTSLHHSKHMLFFSNELLIMPAESDSSLMSTLPLRQSGLHFATLSFRKLIL